MRLSVRPLLRPWPIAAALIVAFGGGALAAGGFQPGTGGVFYACANKTNGAVRLVTPSERCRHTEARTSWGAAGPPGAPGAPGPSGPPGPSGVATLPALEAWHVVGAPGEPALGAGWANYPKTHEEATALGLSSWNTTAEPIEFAKDALGNVHLRGWPVPTSASSSFVIFTLPEAYCPSSTWIGPQLFGTGDMFQVAGATPSGCSVLGPRAGTTWFALDPITFVAGR